MILLDTNALIWWLSDFNRLSKRAIQLIESAELAHFSAASVFEIEIKRQRLKKLPNDVVAAFVNQGFSELPISAADASAVKEVGLSRHDPFDQLLLAQAKNRGLTFITADSLILERGFDFVVDAQA